VVGGLDDCADFAEGHQLDPERAAKVPAKQGRSDADASSGEAASAVACTLGLSGIGLFWGRPWPSQNIWPHCSDSALPRLMRRALYAPIRPLVMSAPSKLPYR
jgi:hypothetical protein